MHLICQQGQGHLMMGPIASMALVMPSDCSFDSGLRACTCASEGFMHLAYRKDGLGIGALLALVQAYSTVVLA